jgi:hypothetical protein
MQTIKLALSETAFQRAHNLAKACDLEVRQFCATILDEAITRIALQKPTELRFSKAQFRPSESDVPDTLKQLYELCRSIWMDKLSFSEAIRRTAYKFNVLESTVRDKYSRRIGLPSTDSFVDLLSRPPELIAHLSIRFPKIASRVKEIFYSIVPTGNGHPSPPRPAMPVPDRVLTTMEYINAIIAVIRHHGGRAEKVVVEAEVFEQFKNLFSNPWYQELEGGGVPRWKKNLQFARHDACHKLGLLKTPEESGRGVWELTETGLNWTAQ